MIATNGVLQCDSCNAVIGSDIAEHSHEVGEHRLCTWCWLRMKERGCIWLFETRTLPKNRYLYPEGQVIIHKKIKKEERINVD